MPPLRERREDLSLLIDHILNRLAYSLDSASFELASEALLRLKQYNFPGNIRELENILQRAVTLIDGHIIQAEDLQLKNSTPSNNQVTQHQLEPGQSLEEYLEDIERDILKKTLEENRWNKTAAAEQLGMSFRSMRYRLKKLNID